LAAEQCGDFLEKDQSMVTRLPYIRYLGMRIIKPTVNAFFHVFNRGVEKRKIFLDDKDHLRFIHDLYELNDRDAVLNTKYYFESLKKRGVSDNRIKEGLRELQRTKKREVLIDIVAFCLMPNHFHLIVQPLHEDGLQLFMQKIGVGYTKYFNHKYKRVGPLFQGPYQLRHIIADEDLISCVGYVHRNPIDQMSSDGVKRGKKFRRDAEKFLQTYRWSSYLDYLNTKNFPSVISQKFFTEMFSKNPQDHKNLILDWTETDFSQLKELKLTIEADKEDE
jgi:putative transposase